MALKIPKHKIDAQAVYVCADDDAWLEPDSEAVRDYLGGVGRYDAEILATLIDESKEPTKWALVRPSQRAWSVLSATLATNGMAAAKLLAVRLCLRSVTGWTCKSLERGKEMSEDEFLELDAYFGRPILQEVGAACFLVAGDLTEAEKKQSGS